TCLATSAYGRKYFRSAASPCRVFSRWNAAKWGSSSPSWKMSVVSMPPSARKSRSPSCGSAPRYRVMASSLQPRQQLRRHLVHLRELIAAGEAEQEVARAGLAPSLEPLQATLDRPRVRGLAGQDRLRGRRVVGL